LFVGLVVGGTASLPGAVIGAAFVQFVPNIAEQVNKSAPGVIYGVLLVAALYFMPDGAAGALRRVLTRRATLSPLPEAATQPKQQGATIHVE
jgi:branched-chain amino acid transport system permease protein